MNKKVKIAAAAVLAVAVGAGGFLTYRHFSSAKNKPKMMNDNLSEKVELGSFTNTISASGAVLLDDEVEVYAEGDTNKIDEILVEEGDTVKAGDVLVTYDVDDTKEELENKIRDTKREIESGQLALQQMSAKKSDTEIAKLKSAVTAKEKALEQAKNSYSSYATKLSQQQSTIDNAQQEVTDAEKDLSDTKALLEVGGASQSEYDNAVSALNKAKNSLADAQKSYSDMVSEQSNAKLGITTAENDLKDAKNEYADAQTPLSTEEEQLKYKQQQLSIQGLQDNLADYEQDLSELVYSTSSNVSGKVTEVCVDEGTYTEENTVILKVADFNKLIVSADIEEYDAPLCAVGQSVVMTSDGLEGKEYTGTVTKVKDSANDTSTNMGTETTVNIEISVDNPDGVLKPGYNLDLEITVLDKQDVLTVSSGAVQTDEKTGEKYVYAVENNKIVKKTVTTGETNDTSIEILTGVSEGDEVIKSPSGEIKDGMSVEEYKAQASQKQENTQSSKDSEQSSLFDMGGMGNDKNRGSDQGVPSGGPGGGGPGGGRPMG